MMLALASRLRPWTQGIALVIVVAADGAHAENKADADAFIKRGVELRKKGQDRAALAEFQRALAIKATPRVFAQIGLAEQALGLWLPAEEHLSGAVKASADPWIIRNRAVLDDALTVVSGHLGTVEVWGEPAGAEVQINGQPAGRLPAPDAVRVIAGACSLAVRAEGYQEAARTLQVSGGTLVRENVQLVRLAPPLARQPAQEPARPPIVTAGARLPPDQPEEHSGVAGRWWFWTAIGVAVVGGAAATFVLLRSKSGVGCPSGVECPP